MPFTEEQKRTAILAVQALYDGNATAGQGKIALDYIIHELSGAYNVSYKAGDPMQTAHNEGRRLVGLKLIETIKTVVARKEVDNG